MQLGRGKDFFGGHVPALVGPACCLARGMIGAGKGFQEADPGGILERFFNAWQALWQFINLLNSQNHQRLWNAGNVGT